MPTGAHSANRCPVFRTLGMALMAGRADSHQQFQKSGVGNGENGWCIMEQVRCAIISTETRVLSGAF